MKENGINWANFGMVIFISFILIAASGCAQQETPKTGKVTVVTPSPSPSASPSSTQPSQVKLVDTKGYPYSPNDKTGIYYYVVSITSDSTGNGLKSYKIANSREKWNSSRKTSLYPTKKGQSLTGKTGKPAIFGTVFPAYYPGKGFVGVEFMGFSDEETKSVVEFNKDLIGLDPSAHGGLYFRGQNDAEHRIPFALELSQDTSGSTFTFDGKTIWYQQNFGPNNSVSSINDYNVVISSGDYVNGTKWTFAKDSRGILTIYSMDLPFGETQAWGGKKIQISGVSYTILEIKNTMPIQITASVDGAVIFRKSNSTGTLIYNTQGDTTDQTYGKLLFTQNSVFDGNYTSNLTLPGNDDKAFYYAVKPYTTGSRLWLLLDADQIGDTLGRSRNDTIQHGKILKFRGTSLPKQDSQVSFTENKMLDYTAERFIDGNGGVEYSFYGANASYYVPQDPDFAGTQDAAGATGKAYYVAEFEVNDRLSPGGFTRVYIDTYTGGNLGPFPNANLSSYTADVDYNGTPAWTLKSGNEASYLKAAYTDAGTKVSLFANDAGARITMPKNRDNIDLLVFKPKGKTNDFQEYNFTLMSQAGSVEFAANNDANALTSTQLSSLINDGKAKEKVGIGVDAKFDNSSNVKDLVSYIESENFYYQVDLAVPAKKGDCIPLFGKYYKITDLNMDRTDTKFVTLDTARVCSPPTPVQFTCTNTPDQTCRNACSSAEVVGTGTCVTGQICCAPKPKTDSLWITAPNGITVIDVSGKVIANYSTAAGSGIALDIAKDKDNNVWVFSPSKTDYQRYFSKFDTKGNMVANFKLSETAGHTFYKIATDNSNNLLAVNIHSNCFSSPTGQRCEYLPKMKKYDPSGKLLKEVSLSNSADDTPEDLAVDKENNIWLRNVSQTVKLDSELNIKARYEVGPNLWDNLAPFYGSSNLAFDSQGNTWTTSAWAGTVSKIDQTGKVTTFNLGDKVSAIQASPDGNIWAWNSSNGSIIVINSAGVKLATYNAGIAPPAMGNAVMAFDSGKNLWIAQAYSKVIKKVSPTGTLLGNFEVPETSNVLVISQ